MRQEKRYALTYAELLGLTQWSTDQPPHSTDIVVLTSAANATKGVKGDDKSYPRPHTTAHQELG